MLKASSDTDVAAILARYPLSSPAVARALQASTRNDAWLIEDQHGRRYVLRRHRQQSDPRRVEFQVRFQQHLLRSGFPTSRVLETCSGEPMAVAGDGVPWALFTHVEGTAYDFTRPGQVAEAARRLAQFHAVAETFPGVGVPVAFDPPIRELWANAEEDQRALRDLHAGSAVEEELASLKAWWDWALAAWPLPRLDALPVGWLHCDYHGRNMVFDGDEMRGMFDFDDLTRGPLIYDVARGVYFFAREARGSFRLRPDVARRFLVEYARGRAITREEAAALPILVALHYPPNPLYHRFCQQRGEDIAARLRREVGTMRALRAEMDRIGPGLVADLGV